LRTLRSGPWVYYRIEADPGILEARLLVRALDRALVGGTRASEDAYRLCTAFTHPRRQETYEQLDKGECTFAELRCGTGM
jgi:hypothetical protein